MMDQALMKDHHHPARVQSGPGFCHQSHRADVVNPTASHHPRQKKKPSSHGRGCQDARFRLESPPLNVHRQGMCADGAWAFPWAVLGTCRSWPWQRHPGRRLCSDQQQQQVYVLTSGQVRAAPLPIFRGLVGIQCPHICVHVHK